MKKYLTKYSRKVWLGFITIFFALCLLVGSVGIWSATAAKPDLQEPQDATDVADGENVEQSYSTSTWLNMKVYDFSYTGGVQSITLGPGKYWFQVWGAEGGGRNSGNNANSGLGGKGGYSEGVIEFNANTNFYVAVGGKGGVQTNTGNAPGGWNGGGQGWASSSGEPGNGGGGATHIARATNRGELRNYNSYRSEIMLVAGAGGGGGEDTGDAYGHGGGTTGVNGTSAYTYTTHGTQTGASYGGGFGYGGGTNKGDGGGGGGGWFGGGTLSTSSVGSDTQGGGGGSGYYNPTYMKAGSYLNGSTTVNIKARTVAGNTSMPSTSRSTETGHSGHGYARITQLNTPPLNKTSRNTVYDNSSAPLSFDRSGTMDTGSSYPQRGAGTIAIPISDIAIDNDTLTKDYMRFYDIAAGGSGNVNIYFASNNTRANTYFSKRSVSSNSWTTGNTGGGNTGGGELLLQPARYFPKTRFYFNAVDNLGYFGKIYFYLEVKDRVATLKKGTYTESSSPYRVGTSTTNEQNTVTNEGVIFNPNHAGTGRNTVVIPSPIPLNSSVTILASNLFSDLDTADKVLITNVSNYGGSDNIYTIVRNNYTTYNGTSNGGYLSLTVTANSSPTAATNYEVLTVSVSTIDSVSGLVTNNTFKIDLVFKIDNTRPIYIGAERMASTSYKNLASEVLSGLGTNDLKVTLPAGGQSQRLYFSAVDYAANKGKAGVYPAFVAYDIDGNTNTIVDAKLPEYEFALVDRYTTPLNVVNGSNYTQAYYGSVSGTPGTASDKNDETWYTGCGTKSTGFGDNIAVRSGLTSSEAYVTYYLDPSGKYIEFTPLRESKYQYSSGAGRLGHFYIMIRVVDSGNATDNGIWYPIAIEVTNANPTSTSPYAESVGEAGGVDYFSPYLIQDDMVGEDRVSLMGDNNNPTSETVNNRLADDIDIFRTSATADASISQFLFIDSNSADIPVTVKNGEYYLYDNEYFTITLVPMFSSTINIVKYITADKWNTNANATTPVKNVTFYNGNAESGFAQATAFSFYGLKVVRHKSTQGKYIEALIPIKDTSGGKANVSLYIKTNNSPLTVRSAADINATKVYTAAESPIIGATPVTISASTNGGNTTVVYHVFNNGRFYISPYDLFTDPDTLSGDYAFTATNTNYINAQGAVNPLYTAQLDRLDGETANWSNRYNLSTSRGEAAASGILQYDKLTFDSSPQISGTAYCTVTAPTEANMSFQIATFRTTPTSAPITFTLRATDGSGTSVSVAIQIHVVNNAPYLRETANWKDGRIYYMSSNYNGLGMSSSSEAQSELDKYLKNDNGGYSYIDPGDENSAYYTTLFTTREFTAVDIANDIESPQLLSFYGIHIGVKTLHMDGNTPATQNGEYVYDDLINATDYVEVSYDISSTNPTGRGRVLRVVAKSSTQNLPGGLFVHVQITDGSGGTSDFYIQIEVINSFVQVNPDAQTGFSAMTETFNQVTMERSVWQIEPTSPTDMSAKRYLVSNNAPFADGFSGGTGMPALSVRNARVLLADNDTAQQFSLVYGNNMSASTYGGTTNSSLIGATASDPDLQGALDKNPVVYDNPYNNITQPQFNSLIKVRYFDNAWNEVANPSFGTEYVNWIIEYSPIADAAFKAEQLVVAVKVKDTLSTGGDGSPYCGNRIKPSTTTVNGTQILLVNIRISSLGIINTFSRYTAVANSSVYGDNTEDNQYYVSDGKTEGNVDPVAGKKEARRYQNFVYDPITFPAQTNAQFGIPISYMALPGSLTGDRVLNLESDLSNALFAQSGPRFIGFKTTSARSAQTDTANNVFNSITLSDGEREWTGKELNNNPYLQISLGNHYDTDANAIKFATQFNTFVNAHAGILVRNGDEANISKFIVNTDRDTILEHGFGLRLRRKGVRSDGQLTLKVELQEWMESDGQYVLNEESGFSTTAVLPITLVNYRMSLTGISSSIDSGITNTIDWTMSGEESKTLALVRNGEGQPTGANGMVSYTDGDVSRISIDGIESVYADKVNYLYSSISRMTKATAEHMVDKTAPSVINTEGGAEKVAKYFGVDAVDANFWDSVHFVGDVYDANPNYTNYFTVSQADSTTDGSLLTFTPVRKTTFDLTGLSESEIIAKAKSRNLLAKYKGTGAVTDRTNWHIYYPFRVVVYDWYKNSGWANSSYQVLTVNVEIENDPPKVNSLYTNSNHEISVSLTKGDFAIFQLSDLIIDNDMIIRGSGQNAKYLTEEQLENYTPAGVTDEKLLELIRETADYLVYVKPSDGHGTVDGSIYTYTFGGGLTIEIDTSAQSLKVIATERPASSDTLPCSVTLKDNNGAVVTLDFAVRVVNKVPTAYSDTNQANVGGYTSYNVQMQSGDYFYLAVSSYKHLTEDNAANNFTTYYNSSRRLDRLENSGALGNLEYYNNNPTYFLTNTSGQIQLRQEENNRTNYMLPVADDDTPWRLRFNSDAATVNRAYTSGIVRYFDILPYDRMPDPSGNGNYPLVYKIAARGAIDNAPLRFTVRDFETDSYLNITINVKVVSSKPEPKEEDLRSDLELVGVPHDPGEGKQKEVVYETTMRYGETRTYNATDFVTDKDESDRPNLYFFNAFNNFLSINGDRTGKLSSANFNYAAAVNVSGTNNVKAFSVTCTNVFLNDQDGSINPYDEVTFYVMDPSGTNVSASSDDAVKVTLRIRTEYSGLQTTTIRTGTSQPADVIVKSREVYEKDLQPTTVQMVKRASTDTNRLATVIDADYTSSNLAYNVRVYALLQEDENGAFSAAAFDSLYNYETGVFANNDSETQNKYFILSWTDKVLNVGENAVTQYVKRYFDLSIAPDGSSLSFVPKMKTLNSLVLYVEVSKPVHLSSNTQDSTDADVGTLYSVNVSNSAPKAIGNNHANSLMDQGEESNYSYKYTEFSGRAGEYRDFPLYNTLYQQQALFLDTDEGDVLSYKAVPFDDMVVTRWWKADRGAKNAFNGYLSQYTIDSNASVAGSSAIRISEGYAANVAPYRPAAVSVEQVFHENDETHTPYIRVTINRKLSATQKGIEVVPIKITAEDTSHSEISTVIWVYIDNTSPTLREVDDSDHAYTLRNEGAAGSENWSLRATVEKGKDLIIRTSDIVVDKDGAFDTLYFADPENANSLGYIDRNPERTLDVRGTTSGGFSNTVLFKITTDDNNSVIRISSQTYNRGAEATAYLRMHDNGGVTSCTAAVTIYLTVANSAPVAKEENLVINIQGGETPPNGATEFPKQHFNILDFVTDFNKEDMTQDPDSSYLRIGFVDASALPTISTGVPDSDGDDGGDKGDGGDEGLFVANLETDAEANTKLEDAIAVSQIFYLRPLARRYGQQVITITVYDDGGNSSEFSDYREVNVTITVNVARAASEQKANDISIAEGRREPITAEVLLDSNNIKYSIGYKLKSLVLSGVASNLLQVGEDIDIHNNPYTYLLANVGRAGQSCSVTAMFEVAGAEVPIDFNVSVIENRLPVLIEEFATTKLVYASMYEGGSYRLRPTDVFRDPENGNMTFKSVKSKQPLICDAYLDANANMIVLQFKANKPVEVEVTVYDETMRNVTETITLQAPDESALNFFANMVVLVQSNLMWSLIILAILLLLLIILIIIIVTVRKKKKMRKEIEALLMSEMELEEQMLKLSAGTNASYYQSFGYLPPTQQMPTQGYMLGNGQNTQAPVQGAIGLNPGAAPNTPSTPQQPSQPADPSDLDNF